VDATTIWALRKPVVSAWRKLVGFMGAWTVEPIFRQAHDHHVALRHWQRRWVELADGIEYKLHTRTGFDETGHAEQSILIRNSGNVQVDDMKFCVEARLGIMSYQVPLTVYRLQPGRVAKLVLTGLPVEDLFIHEERIYQTYESIQVYPVQVERDRHIEVYATPGIVLDPTHNDLLNGEWKRWNGRLYNTKALADARRENLLRLSYSLCGRHGLIGFDVGTLLAQALRTKRYRNVPGVLMFGLASSRPILNLILWTRLLLRIERVAFECDASMAAATEHVMHKGQSAGPVRVVSLEGTSMTREGY